MCPHCGEHDFHVLTYKAVEASTLWNAELQSLSKDLIARKGDPTTLVDALIQGLRGWVSDSPTTLADNILEKY